MKKNNALSGVVLVCSLLTFTGCGEAVIPLTDQEASAIAKYAAKVVSVYNTDQVIGLCNANISDAELGIEPYEAPPPEEEEPKELIEDEAPPEEEPLEEGTQEPEPAVSASELNLTDIIGADGVEFVIEGFDIDVGYSTSHFALNADSGCQFVIFSVIATNVTEEKRTVDILNGNMNFFCEVNGVEKAAAKKTILDYDLATYEDEIEPGKSKELVLIFQYKGNVLEDISRINLLVEKDGTLFSTVQ